MRVLLHDGNLRVDLIHTPDQIADVVRLVTAAGLNQLRISPDGEGPSIAVDALIPDGFGDGVLPQLLAIVAAISGRSEEHIISQWHERATDFAAVAEGFGSPANG